MHRNSTQTVLAADSLPSPKDKTNDMETDRLIAEKKQELEEEITRFKLQKEKEFQTFEHELRSRRRGRSPGANRTARHEATKTSVLGLLDKGAQHAPVKGVSENQDESKGTNRSSGPKPKPPLSKPTISMDSQNISSNHDLQLKAEPSGRRTPVAQDPSMNTSSTRASLTITTQKSQSPLPTPTKDNPEPLVGLFTPTYLPLLDANPAARSQSQPIPKTIQSSYPMASRASTTNSASSSLPSSHSLSPILHHQPERAQTAPAGPAPSTSLPLASALRTASRASMRKRKHVTFQLANSGAIVEPSSSYEEIPSPEPKGPGREAGFEELLSNGGHVEDHDDVDVGDDDGVLDDSGHATPLPRGSGLLTPPPSRPGADSKPPGYFSPSFGPHPHRPLLRSRSSGSSSGSSPSPLRSPALLEPTSPTHSSLSVSIDHAQTQAKDGGSGIGFFELDEELESPGFRVPNEYLEAEDNEEHGTGDETLVDDIEADEHLDGDPELVGVPTSGNTKSQGIAFARKDSKCLEISPSFGLTLAAEKGMETITSTVGSVPIDIVRPPTGSWVGSFGH